MPGWVVDRGGFRWRPPLLRPFSRLKSARTSRTNTRRGTRRRTLRRAGGRGCCFIRPRSRVRTESGTLGTRRFDFWIGFTALVVPFGRFCFHSLSSLPFIVDINNCSLLTSYVRCCSNFGRVIRSFPLPVFKNFSLMQVLLNAFTNESPFHHYRFFRSFLLGGSRMKMVRRMQAR